MPSTTIRGIVTLVILGLGGGLSGVAEAQRPRHLVVHAGTADHTIQIKTALLAAFNDNGILEFEAGKIYRTTEIRIWQNGNGLPGTPSTPRKMPAAIEGNGATLKWVEHDEPSPGASLLYLWHPHDYGNAGFYIRNLTLDCGNNTIGDLDDAPNGQLQSSDKACDYGLRLWGGDSLLVENVAVLRAASAGVYVQTSSGNSVDNTVFRNVNARYGASRGGGFLTISRSRPEAMSNWKTAMRLSIWVRGSTSMTPTS